MRNGCANGSDVNIGMRTSHSCTSTTRMSGQYISTSGRVSPSLLGMSLTGCLTGIWLCFPFGGNSFYILF